MTIAPKAGDVMLLESSTPFKQDPWPCLIKRLTKSKFSHSIVVLGQDRFADANPAAKDKGDIQQWGAERLAVTLQKSVGLTLLRPTGQVADEQLLDAAFERLRKKADHQDVVFSDGAVFALALLRGLQTAPAWMRELGEVRRLRLATLWVMETHGESRLFCSEFVYRALTEAGQQPALPDHPVVPVDDFPTEGLAETSDDEFLRLVHAWLMKWLNLDEDSIRTIQETWDGIRDAYKGHRKPNRIDVGNYFTPQDFAMSGSLRCIATRTHRDPLWVPASGPC